MVISKQAYQNIMAAAAKIEMADDAMTAAILALEANDYQEARRQVSIVLNISDGIEQRLAAQYIRQLAEDEDMAQSVAALKLAYDYNNRVHQQFFAKCEEFNASMRRIQEKLCSSDQKGVECRDQ